MMSSVKKRVGSEIRRFAPVGKPPHARNVAVPIFIILNFPIFDILF